MKFLIALMTYWICSLSADDSSNALSQSSSEKALQYQVQDIVIEDKKDTQAINPEVESLQSDSFENLQLKSKYQSEKNLIELPRAIGGPQFISRGSRSNQVEINWNENRIRNGRAVNPLSLLLQTASNQNSSTSSSFAGTVELSGAVQLSDKLKARDVKKNEFTARIGSFQTRELKIKNDLKKHSFTIQSYSSENNYSFDNPLANGLTEGAPPQLRLENAYEENQSFGYSFDSRQKAGVKALGLQAPSTKINLVAGQSTAGIPGNIQNPYLTTYLKEQDSHGSLERQINSNHKFGLYGNYARKQIFDPNDELRKESIDTDEYSTQVHVWHSWKSNPLSKTIEFEIRPMIGEERFSSSASNFSDKTVNSRYFSNLQLTPTWLISDQWILSSDLEFDIAENERSFLNREIKLENYTLPNTILWAKFRENYLRPTLNEYYQSGGLIQGNPNLNFQESNGFDVGVGWQSKILRQLVSVDINYFQTEYQNLINYEQVSFFQFKPFNLGSASASGVETTLKIESESMYTFQLVSVFQETENTTPNDPTRGNALPFSPSRRFQALLDLNIIESFTIGFRSKILLDRFTNTTNTQKLAKYENYDIVTSYQTQNNLTFSLEARNILNRTNFDLRGYPLATRAFYANIRRLF